MTHTGRCGLAKYAARGKQYLVVVRPVTGHEGGLMMQQLSYADEVRSFRTSRCRRARSTTPS